MFEELLGWDLESAISVISEAGYAFKVCSTGASRLEPVGNPRVARITEIEANVVELIVVYNDEPESISYCDELPPGPVCS
ncbi:MAG: hypothetical protein AB1500_02195 [Bacillota bacterium]